MGRGVVVLPVLLAGCTLYFGDDAGPPASDPPGDPDPAEAIVERVAQPIAGARDIAVDDRYVYWTEQWADASGIVVRWDKATHERRELALVQDGLPAELELAGGYVYWTVQRGWGSHGRVLGHDWLMRVAVDGTGVPETVATEQRFDQGRGALAAFGATLYWLDEGGSIRAVDGAAAAPIVDTLRSGLDLPRVIGANATRVCFRTGHPNLTSSIYCHDTTTNTLRTVGGGFPRALVFEGDTLHWADEQSGLIVAATPSGTTTVLQIGPSFMVLGLTRAQRNLFWNQTVEYPRRDTIRMSRPDGTIATVASNAGHIRAFAVDDADVYFIDSASNGILRAERPY